MTLKQAKQIAAKPLDYCETQRRVAFLKLGNAALRAFPSSPHQKQLHALAEILRPYYVS